MSLVPENSALYVRAQMLRQVREFFYERKVVEVDCSALSPHPTIDAHIDLIKAEVMGERSYLHSSPEYRMKELLGQGVGDIYQLSHVFRDGERGARHRPEFMMIEWYRAGFTLKQMWEETAEVIGLFVGPLPLKVMSYRGAFLELAGVDVEGPVEMLAECAGREGEREELLSYLLVMVVEPKLLGDRLYVITHFPTNQAALAKVSGRGAERFEIFYQGTELANGYDELNDPVEQKRRCVQANRERGELRKEVYGEMQPMPKLFPECCGVAVGFDRLLMLKLGATDIGEVLY